MNSKEIRGAQSSQGATEESQAVLTPSTPQLGLCLWMSYESEFNF